MGYIQITTNNLILMIKEIMIPIMSGFANPIRKFTLVFHLSESQFLKETAGATPKGKLVFDYYIFYFLVDYLNFNTIKKN
jgi:hypothetical protein